MRAFYLSNRGSLAFYSNCTVALAERLPAAELILKALQAPAPSHFFSTSRLPALECDRLVYTGGCDHIIVACLGQFYEVQVGENLDVVLEQLVNDAICSERQPEIGWLSLLPRNAFTEAFELLHGPSLTQLQSALLFVAFEFERTPGNITELANHLAHGGFENRWFNQSQQLIIFASGAAGFNFDHTVIDGQPAAVYVNSLPSQTRLPLPFKGSFRKLVWFDSEKLQGAIEQAKKYASQELARRQILCFEKSPQNSDFDIQFSIQNAIRNTFKSSKTTSEAVSMSHLPEGRYNTIYFDSPESVINTFRDKIQAAKAGHGFEVPCCDISTSSGGSFKNISVFGFTDTEPNMIGIAYMRKPDKTVFHISCDGDYFGFAKSIASCIP